MSDFPDLADEPAPPTEAAPVHQDLSLYRDFLVSQGYRPELDDDGDLRFRHEGRTYYLVPDPSDPVCFRIALPGFWECADADEERRALLALNAVNRDLKAVKCVLVDGSVWISIELFFDPPDSFQPVFVRCLDALGMAVWEFRARMRSRLG